MSIHSLLASFISTARSARVHSAKLALVGLLLGCAACDGQWELEQKLDAEEAPPAAIQGLAVAIHGNIAAITVADPPGVDVYRRDVSGAWEFIQRIGYRAGMPTDASFRFGESVAVHGNTLAIGVPKYIPGGAYYTGTDYGYIEIYRRGDSGVFSYDHTVRPTIEPGTVTSSNFATSIDLEGEWLVAGSNFHIERIGRVFVFKAQDGVFTQVQTLTDPALTSDAHFGFAVDLSGQRLAVAQPGVTTAMGGRDGKVVVYQRGEAGFTQEQIIVCPEAGPVAAGDRFGSSIALNAGRLAVTRPGRVYVFEHDDTDFVSTFSADADVGDYFSIRRSLALTAGMLIVGENHANALAGLVRIHDLLRGTVFTTLLDPESAVAREFGAAVAADGASLLVSSGGGRANPDDAVYTYRFKYEDPAP